MIHYFSKIKTKNTPNYSIDQPLQMFRVSDPLGGYTKDPRLERSSRFSAPPSIPTQAPTKEPSSKACYIFLISLLVIFGFVLLAIVRFQNNPTFDGTMNFEETFPSKEDRYLDYKKFIRVTENAHTVERYILEKLSAIPRLDDDGNLKKPVSSYHERFQNIQKLREKSEELIALSQDLNNKALAAEKSESRLGKLKEEYDVKMEKIDQLGNETLNAIQNIMILKSNVSTWQEILNELNGKMKHEDKDLTGKKQEFYDSLTIMNNKITEHLQGSHLKEEELEPFLRSKERLIEDIQLEKSNCQHEITEREEEIAELKKRNQTLSSELLQVEFGYRQKRLEIHSLETAKKMEKSLLNMRILQKEASETAKQWIDEVVESLTAKQREYKSIQNGKSADPQELETLRVAIENDKQLLNTWVLEQFKTLRISTEEIRNVTRSINELHKPIKTDLTELESLISRRKTLIESVQEMPQQLSQLKLKIQQCQVVISEDEKKLERENKDYEEKKTILDNVKKLREKMRIRQENFVNEEKEIGGAKGALEREKHVIEQKIYNAKVILSRNEAEVKQAARTINDLVEKEPTGDHVEKQKQTYFEEGRAAEEIYERMMNVIEEIKQLL